MHKNYARTLLASAILIAALVLFGATKSSGSLFAQGPGSSAGPGAQSGGQTGGQGGGQSYGNQPYGSQGPTSPSSGAQGGASGSSPTQGPSGAAGPSGSTGSQTGGMNQSDTGQNRARTSWGGIILSFILGLIVGGLVFYNWRAAETRRDTRRAA
jgi:hypothetical protein